MSRMIRCILQLILSTTCTCAYNNLALGKPAWQRTAFSQSLPWGADKAVDGKYTDRGANGNQCTISADKQQTAEWRVDLGSVVSISYINIFYRTDNNPGSYAFRFAGFYVYVSNTTSKEGGILCFHELQTVSGTPVEDQRINCSVYGQYVIYYNERLSGVVYPTYYSQFAFNALCELEVYGCPIPGYYGEYCNQTCPVNCQGQQCDAVTGDCVKGCLSGYQGSHCSYLNLALRRPAWQEHNWPDKPVAWGAGKAVDGRYSDRGAIGGQCTISGPSQRTAEWRVDLEKIVSISHIHIYYRTDNFASPSVYHKRFAGFYVYVSNSTDKDSGCLCFHELQQISGTPTEDQKINCPYDGRYVIYYNERRPEVTYPSYYSQYAYNDLCELEVYGCPESKFYGQYCDQLCPENCLEQRCNMFTGNCFECNPGYKGQHCSRECDGRMYGPACNHSCGHCLHNTQCHHINGFCTGGCSAGYEGSLCQKQCDGGRFGLECNKTCGHCLNGAYCSHIDGSCSGGCTPGYKAPLCKEKCDSGMYGTYCSETCGFCLNDTQCHHVNGSCLQGCSAGYEGILCKKECDDGRYGLKCNQTCGECIYGGADCYHENGTCLEGCSPGYTDSLCKTECSGGMYGYNCNISCGHCLNDTQCNHINGSCLQGCSAGYKKVLCSEECDGRMYGENCNRKCGHCFDDEQCYHINGTCLQGCSIGYKGLLCTKECDDGMYGINCIQVCGHCLNYEKCLYMSGTCLQGCSKGYNGSLCNAECEGGKYGYNCNESCGHCMNNTTCNHVNGTCPEGCAVGYEGSLCTNVCRPSNWGVNCKERCSTECVSQTCHHESGHCLSYEQAESCGRCTCKNDYTITITSIVVSILIVVMGSLINYLIWRRMQPKGTVVDTHNDREYYNEFSVVDTGDKQSERDVVTSPYAELSELDHQSTYEELHQYEKADGKM